MSVLAAGNAAKQFNKMIVLQAGSILEASLSQIIYRAQNFNLEGVPNISEGDRSEIAGKKVDKFSSTIDVLQKYHVLDGINAGIYRELHKLRRYRNKIHIQDDMNIDNVRRDEDQVFSLNLTSWAMELNLRVLRHLSEKYPRPQHANDYVESICVPTGFP